MRICKDCKYWGVDFDRVCDLEGIEGDKGFNIYVYANDDQGLEARLVTSPDFGCVNFVEEEETHD